MPGLFFYFAFFLIWHFFADAYAQTFSFGRFSIGETRIKAELSDFVIHSSNPAILKASWVFDSVQWIRNENNLLVPRALLKVQVLTDKETDSLFIDYKNAVVLPYKKNGEVESIVYMDLFYPAPVVIFNGKEVIGRISIEAKEAVNARSKQLIDYSCSPFSLNIEGIDSEYLSVGCNLIRLGSFLNGYPRLEVTMSSTNLKTLNDDHSPFTVYLNDNSPVEVKVKGQNDQIKTIRLKAHLPERLKRLKTALGVGPYVYESQYFHDKQVSNYAPSVMFYAKFDLNETASLKAFDALLYSRSFFNNSGLYFSYDLAEVFDGRVLLNALLGFQGLHYKFDKSSPTEFHLIYPQGFELIYKHAFKENYNLVYGMFLASGTHDYTNAWIRYGSQSFLEFNYIGWNKNQSHIKMWGISVGFPFFSAF